MRGCRAGKRDRNMDILKDILFQFSLAALCTGSIAGVLMGIAMLFAQERIMRLNHYFSRWFGADKVEEQLNRPRWIERYVYRHHRLAGAVLLFGASFIFQ